MVFEEIPVDIRAIFGYFFCIPGAFTWVEYRWNNKKLRECPPVFLQKSDITVLYSDYTNLFASTLVNLRLEKEK